MLSARRDAKAAKRFFLKVLNGTHTQTPRVINVDKNAAYPLAISSLKESKLLPETTELRPVKYLNNLIEQDHRFIKRRTNPGLGFGSFNTARRTIQGYEAMHMIRKGQVRDVEKKDILGQISFIHKIFGVAA
jgi:transposase, IS6 family